MTDDILVQINKFLRTRKGAIGGYEGFKKTGLYEHHANIFGHLIYTEDTKYNYIGVDKNGNIYDEIYYPYPDIKKMGTIVPKHLYEQGYDVSYKPVNPIWKDVAEKGFAVVETPSLPLELRNLCLSEGFIPFGYNEESNLSKSIYHSYFDPMEDRPPEDHVSRSYLKSCADFLLQSVPNGQTFINNWVLHTTDIKKYVYDPKDLDCVKGAHSFHMDYFPRGLFMFFSYLAKKNPIIGRELLVGFREDFSDFSSEALDLSPGIQPSEESPFARLSDDKISYFETIPIRENQMIIMNTMNPMIVHKVAKLREQNEVVLLVTNLWCKYRVFED